MGHVHLKVAGLERSVAFYRGVLGFEVTQRYGEQAAFLSAGGYHIDEACSRGEDVVLACSALKHDYREYLERHGPECVQYVYLHAPEELIRRRLAQRKGHFMDPALLPSQFEALEPPEDAVRVDVTPAPEVIAAEIRRKLAL